MVRSEIVALLILFGAFPARTQEPPATLLEVTQTTEVRMVTSPGMLNPIVCSGDAIYLRMAGPGVQDLLSVSKDGNTIVRFTKDKVTDVSSPTLGTFFVSGTDVYVLETGYSNPRPATVQIQTPEGTQKKETESFTARRYIAKFKSDGSFERSIPLDIPFRPLQIGAFENGTLLVAGVTDDTEPRLAIVGANGQFSRFVELNNDIGSESNPAEKKDKVPALPAMDSVQHALVFSQLVADGPNILLVRKGQRSPIFSISPGGIATAIKLDVPAKYSLFSLRTAPGVWIAQFVYRVGEVQGIRFMTYTFDPTSGKPSGRFVYPTALGLGMACATQKEFTFLKKENGSLYLVKTAISGRSAPPDEPPETEQKKGTH